MKMIHDWYEIWVEEQSDSFYFLLVCPEASKSERIVIIDPKENYQIIQNMPDYKTATLWLLEDEFELVRGRMEYE